MTTANVDIYRSVGNDKSTELFEFLAGNSNVEWSQIKTISDGLELNYLATSHVVDGDVSQSIIISQISSSNQFNSITGSPKVNITEANHSHTNGSIVVSPGDVKVAETLQSDFPNAKMHNVTFSNRQPIYTEFNRYSMPGLLPAIKITP